MAVLAAGAYAALRFANRPGSPPPQPSSAVPATPPAPAAEATAAAPPAVEAPVGAEGAQTLLESVSANALFRTGLAQKDLIHRWAVITDNVAEDVSPRSVLGFLAPRAPFSVARRGDRLTISPESYARYDGVADAVDSVDAHALATAYRRLHAVLDAAYQALGFPPGSLDRTTARALHRIADAPVAGGDVYVESREGLYVLADPHLEQLGDVEKHLLRMGPRNERLVQAKAREMLDALHLPAVAAAPR